MNPATAENILQDVLSRYGKEDTKKLGKELLTRLELKCKTSKPWSKFVQDVEKLVDRKLKKDEKTKLYDLYDWACNQAPQEAF